MTTNLTVNFVGEEGVIPRKVCLSTSVSYDDLTAEGFLDETSKSQGPLMPTDIIFASYNNGEDLGIFYPTFSDGNITLIPMPAPVLETVSGNFVNFTSTTGNYDDLGYSPTDDTKTKVVMKVGTPTAGNLASFDSNGSVQDSDLVANTILYSSLATPDVNANLVYFSATATTAALNSGAVTLFTSSGSKSYIVLMLRTNGALSSFTTGDKNLAISDGTNTYSVIPSASLLAQVNAVWGATALPLPAAAFMTTPTVAGQSLRCAYSGGTTNYDSGKSITISGLLLRVA